MDDEHDRTLGEAARQGQRAAFDELYRRHAASTWRLALAVSRDPAAAAAALSSAFAAVLAGRSDDGHRSERALAVELAAATRAAARDAAHLETVVRSATGVLHLDASQARMGFVCRAFDTLPERWRSALWLVDVEGWAVADAAAVLDMAPAAVEGLLARARLGLREQVLVSGLRRPSPTECRRTTDCLTGYAAGSLTERQTALVRRHLDGCDECRDRLGALDDLVPVLRGGAVVLPLSLADQAAARWASARVRPASRLLALPGGRTLPAWAERAFAGSVAAVVTLGIAAATMLATRDRGGSNLPLPPVAAAAPPQVLSDPTGPDFQGTAPVGATFAPPSEWLGAGAGAGGGIGAPRPAASLPRSQSGGSPPLGDGGTGSTAPPSSSPPPTAPPVDDSVVTAGVAGVGGVAVGEECAGGHAAGTTAGCAPSGSSSDTVSVGGSLLQ